RTSLCPLSLHDALPISPGEGRGPRAVRPIFSGGRDPDDGGPRRRRTRGPGASRGRTSRPAPAGIRPIGGCPGPVASRPEAIDGKVGRAHRWTPVTDPTP